MLLVCLWGFIGSLPFASGSNCGDFSTVLFPTPAHCSLGSASAAIFITPHLIAEGRHARNPTVGRPVVAFPADFQVNNYIIDVGKGPFSVAAWSMFKVTQRNMNNL